MENSCIFCNFQEKYIIAESEYAFATYFPRAIKKGHFVVAIKEHLPTFTDLSIEQAGDLIQLALRLAKKAEVLLRADKYYLVAIGDKDFHFHVHLLPKLSNDTPMGKHIMLDEGWKGEVGQAVSEEEVSEFINMLRSA
jgi:diadenosine tetraphosphate (Ap4A) HIT family hydrolase